MAPGTVIGGKYRLLRQLDAGGMGVVWAAKHEVTGRDVAVKLLTGSTPDSRARLLREARACGRLSHRNIIEVLDVGELEGRGPFLVMPLLTGETLAGLLARQRRLLPSIAAQIARDVARALEAAHAAQIIHRDLKPANIFLHQEAGTEGHVVKVLDFGVSKNLAEQDGLMTMVGGAVGSPAYMSPEQIAQLKPAGRRPEVDYRTDLWSLGVVLFEMLTGRRPFDGETPEVMRMVTSGPIPSVSEFVRSVELGLDELVSRCLQRNPEERIASAADLAKALNGYNEASRVYTGLPVRSPTPEPEVERRDTGPSPYPAGLHVNPVPRRPQDYVPTPQPALVPPSSSLLAGGTIPIPVESHRLAVYPPAPPPPAPPPPSVATYERMQGAAAVEPPSTLNGATTERLDMGHIAAWRAGSTGPKGAPAEATSSPSSISYPPASAQHPLSDALPVSNVQSHISGLPAPARQNFASTLKLPPTLPGAPSYSPSPSSAPASTPSTAPLIQSPSTAPHSHRGSQGAAPDGPRQGRPLSLWIALAISVVALVGACLFAIIMLTAGPVAAVSSAESSSVASGAPLPPANPSAIAVIPSSAPSASASASAEREAPVAPSSAAPEPSAPPTASAFARPAPVSRPASSSRPIERTNPFGAPPAPKPASKPASNCGKLVKKCNPGPFGI